MGLFAGTAGERGQVSLPLLAVVLASVVVAAAVAIGSSLHSARAARVARAVSCAQLAAGGAEWALARIPALPDVWTYDGTGPEGQGTVRVTWSDAEGVYTVVSQACAGTEEKRVTVKAAPPPPPYNFLAGDVSVTGDVGVAGLVHALRVAGDVNASGAAALRLTGTLGPVSSLAVQGTVRAAAATLECQPAGSTVDGGTVAVDLADIKIVKSPLCTVKYTQQPPAPVPPFRYHSADAAYFEAVAADLERRGQLPAVAPADAVAAGCAFPGPARVTGDLDCGAATLTIPQGAFVVVDGKVQAQSADVGGVLYARGAAAPDPRGDVTVADSLRLAQVAAPPAPLRGGGTVAATGNVSLSGATLVAALPAASAQGSLLQVLALAAGAGDARNDVQLQVSRVIDLLGGGGGPPLFLYAADGGQVTVTFSDTLDVGTADTLPLTAVAGKKVAVDVSGALQALSSFTLKPVGDAWTQVPPPLRSLGRVRVLSWRTD